jgi:hypothetical protein
MSTTRRTILSGALAAPFLVNAAGTAAGTTQDARWGTVSDGYVDLWLTSQAQRQLDLWQATATPIAPATALTDGGRKGVRFPIRSGTGELWLNDLSQTHGTGLLDGGMIIRTLTGQFEITQLQPAIENGQASGTYQLNSVEGSGQSLLRYDAATGRLLADPVPAGHPLKVRIEEVPVYPTPESLEALRTAVGTAVGTLPFDLNTVVAHATADFVYTPPQS